MLGKGACCLGVLLLLQKLNQDCGTEVGQLMGVNSEANLFVVSTVTCFKLIICAYQATLPLSPNDRYTVHAGFGCKVDSGLNELDTWYCCVLCVHPKHRFQLVQMDKRAWVVLLITYYRHSSF